jgi:apolipoprotein N-acyltransferase
VLSDDVRDLVPLAQNHPFVPVPLLLGDLLALAAGALLPLAFSPYDFYPMAPALLALLFALWLGVSSGRASWRGWLFGAGMFGAGVHWVYFSMHVFGHMAPAVAVSFTALFAALMALFPALAGWISVRWFSSSPPVRLLIVIPAVWTLAEWVRSWFLTGFPWLNVGYSQVDSPLVGFAPLTGVYGITWALAVSAGLLVLLVSKERAKVSYVLALLVVWGGAWFAGKLEWTEPAGAPLRVSLIQGNIEQDDKWRLEWREATLERYASLTRKHWDSDLIIWPETAVPDFYDTVEDNFLRVMEAEARQHDTDLLLGIPLRNDSGQYYNSVISIGRTLGFYRKHHLVPFGEYIPLHSILGRVLDILQVPMSDFSAGAQQQSPLRADGYAVGTTICYEIAFGEEVIRALPDAAFLVNVSNNAWFGDSAAPHQQLQMGRMRARETGRYLLSATNNGVTAIVDNRGKAVSVAPQFEVAVLTGTVEPRKGATPYVRLGNFPVIAVMGLLLAAAALSGGKRRRP